MSDTVIVDTSVQSLVEGLQSALGRYRQGLEQAEIRAANAQQEVQEWQDRIAKAEALLEFERRRNGVRPAGNAQSPYEGLPFRDAVVKVIERSRGNPVTDREIVDALLSWGYPLKTRHPGRSIHAALIKVDAIQKIGKGRYRIIEGKAQATLPSLGNGP